MEICLYLFQFLWYCPVVHMTMFPVLFAVLIYTNECMQMLEIDDIDLNKRDPQQIDEVCCINRILSVWYNVGMQMPL